MITGLDRLSIYGDELFNNPLPRQDCPICFLPLSFCPSEYAFQACCRKRICDGCINATDEERSHTNAARYLTGMSPLPQDCPFCRASLDSNNNEGIKRCKKRMTAKDANAFHHLGMLYKKGSWGLSQDYTKAFEMFLKGAELGLATAQFMVGI